MTTTETTGRILYACRARKTTASCLKVVPVVVIMKNGNTKIKLSKVVLVVVKIKTAS